MNREPNPYIGINYLPLNTRMAEPPTFWLQRLFDYDDKLVVFPSFMVPYAYVLARRQTLARGLTDFALEATVTNLDTKICLTHKLVPVSMIYRTGVTWSIDNVIASLAARDIWRQGGAKKVADNEDAADEAKRQKTQKDVRDDMWNRSGDAWRSYQARTGQRNQR